MNNEEKKIRELIKRKQKIGIRRLISIVLVVLLGNVLAFLWWMQFEYKLPFWALIIYTLIFVIMGFWMFSVYKVREITDVQVELTFRKMVEDGELFDKIAKDVEKSLTKIAEKQLKKYEDWIRRN